MGQSGSPDRHVTTDVAAVADSECTILHVDMDAFFAEVELLRRPELRGRPMMVAGDQGRGVVLSATYPARRRGVRSGMPTGAACRLCPEIDIVPPDHAAYRAVSVRLMALLEQFTPLVEPVSVDEAFLDVAGARRQHGRPGAIAAAIRARIRADLGLPATVGAASTKFVAKLGSGLAKPDGLLVVPPAEVLSLLHPLPVRALWGVGPRIATTLESYGIATVGEVAAAGRAVLVHRLGVIGGKLFDLACGRDDRKVTPGGVELSVGAETTFAHDLVEPGPLRRELLDLAEQTARRARASRRKGRTITLKVRFDDFSTLSRNVTLDTPTDIPAVIYAHAARLLLRAERGTQAIRLLGIRLEGLERAERVTEQLAFGDSERSPGWDQAEAALDQVAARFGVGAIRRATLVPAPGANLSVSLSSTARLEVPAADSYPDRRRPSGHPLI